MNQPQRGFRPYSGRCYNMTEQGDITQRLLLSRARAFDRPQNDANHQKLYSAAIARSSDAHIDEAHIIEELAGVRAPDAAYTETLMESTDPAAVVAEFEIIAQNEQHMRDCLRIVRCWAAAIVPTKYAKDVIHWCEKAVIDFENCIALTVSRTCGAHRSEQHLVEQPLSLTQHMQKS